MYELVLTPEAFDDLRAARIWYEEQRSGLGAAFERSIEATLMRVLRLPESFPEMTAPFRRAIVKRYPYDVYYEFDARRVVVVLIFHTARDPKTVLARLRRH